MKAAFTRAYNKEVHRTPYSLQAVKKTRRGGGGDLEMGGEEGPDDQESENEAEELKTDAMIKVSVFRHEQVSVHLSVCSPGWFLSAAEEEQNN